MASIDRIFELFLSPMKRMFQRPMHLTDQTESVALTDYSEALRPFSDAALTAGWKAVRDAHTNRSWPVPAVCIKACASAQRDFREHRQTTTGIKPESGRMVGGEWQPWSGCNCERCRCNRQARQAESVALFGEPKPLSAYLQRRPDESQTEYRRRVVTMLEMPIPVAALERTLEQGRK